MSFFSRISNIRYYFTAIPILFSIICIMFQPTALSSGFVPSEPIVIDTDYTEKFGSADRLHFLNTGSGNCIIIESNGLFAMLDAAEDSDNPKGLSNLELDGYEDYILAYLKENCADANGKVTLEFALGTHAHSDHIGGFDTIFNDSDVIVKKFYLKEYNADNCILYERFRWDNEEVYNQAVAAAESNSIEIISDIPDSEFAFGDFTVQFMNTEPDYGYINKNENDNSVVTLIKKDDRSALITADLNWLEDNDEAKIEEQTGEIDLLEMGHHGNLLSSSPRFVRAMNPKAAIACNTEENLIFKSIIKTYSSINCPIYPTVENDEIIAHFTDSGKIILDCDYICKVQTAN